MKDYNSVRASTDHWLAYKCFLLIRSWTTPIILEGGSLFRSLILHFAITIARCTLSNLCKIMHFCTGISSRSKLRKSRLIRRWSVPKQNSRGQINQINQLNLFPHWFLDLSTLRKMSNPTSSIKYSPISPPNPSQRRSSFDYSVATVKKLFVFTKSWRSSKSGIQNISGEASLAL